MKLPTFARKALSFLFSTYGLQRLTLIKFLFTILMAFALLSLPGCAPKITPMMKRWPISYSGYHPREQPVTVEGKIRFSYFAGLHSAVILETNAPFC